MDAFQALDRTGKGWVSAPEIVDSLTDLGSYVHRDDVYLFVRRWDKDSDGRIMYSDFCDAFTPKS
jgi:Ca2+-binding EF-hand superfamily protein